uniref:FHA domain-containing protein n=1 Tax=Hyaloperonospora arabidopsidis (strain Emoy2) TaxID=559515 RepID=M4BEY3_HYAAE
MASLLCFRLEATRGPHAGSTYRYCFLSHSTPGHSFQPLGIGRKKGCWLRLVKDLEVSTIHAEFRFLDAAVGETKVALCDSNSTNGTKLNGELLKPQQDYKLTHGDLIAVGRTGLRFVQTDHGRLCGVEEGPSAATSAATFMQTSGILVSSPIAPSTRAPVVIELDDEKVEETCALPTPAVTSALLKASEPVIKSSVEQPETEPALGELVVKELLTSVASEVHCDSGNHEEDDVDSSVENVAASGGEIRSVVVEAHTPEEATCTTCNGMIGRLSILEQQAHHNACLGGRVTAALPTKAFITKNAKPRSRKRVNTASGVARVVKPAKPKANKSSERTDAAAIKTKKTRKRKRADAGEDIILALAAVDTPKLDKEQQTDLQLAATKKKLAQLDDQMKKLAKRRINLVKTMERLEKTKDKFRKSQVLPPAKVVQLLDMKSALDVIFPSNRRAGTIDRRVNKVRANCTSIVSKKFTSSTSEQHVGNSNCDDDSRDEQAAVAAISMWSRASQQLFGLQYDSLLYHNSVLRTFTEHHDSADNGSLHTEVVDCVSSEDGKAAAIDSTREHEDKDSELVDMPPINILDPTRDDPKVPDAVKRVFPNWQRDLAFLRDQSADDIGVALETLKDAQAEADVATPSNSEASEQLDCFVEKNDNDKHGTDGSACVIAQDTDKQVAYDYMAQVMMQLIAEKQPSQCAVSPARSDQEQTIGTKSVECMEENQEEMEQPVVVSIGVNDEKVDDSSCLN